MVLGRRDRGREELGRGTREGNGMRRGGTRAGFKVWLEGVSHVWELLCKGRQHLPREAVTA